MKLPYPLTVAALEAWLKRFPADALVRAEEGEIVVVTGDESSMTVHPIETPIA